MTVPRAAVQALVSEDSVLGMLGVEGVYGSNSADSPAESLFIVLHWESTTKAFGSRGPTTLTCWVHDKNRDYARVDKVIVRLKEILLDAVHVSGADGVTLTSCTWAGDSDDLVDDGYNTVTRTVAFETSSRATLN